jgi:tetratricopeptide (TPR) repeat protein
MGRTFRAMVAFPVLGLASAALPPVAVAQQCTVERMEVAPLAVLEPCSDLLKQTEMPSAQRAEALFVRGRAHHRNGSIDLAADDYDEALKLAPDNEEIHLARANIDFRRGLDDEALVRIQKAISLNPKNPRVLRSIGAVFSSAGQIEEAMRFLSAALLIDPAEPYALLLRSQLHAQKKRYKEAIADADALVKIPPETINRIGFLDSAGKRRDFHVAALTHRAELYEDAGDDEMAQRDYDAAVAYKNAPEALLARGEFFATRPGKEAAALRDLDAVLQVETDDARVHFVRGIALSNLKRPRDAVAAFDAAIRLRPSYPVAFRMRSRAHRELGNDDAAVQDFVVAMRQDSALLRQTMPALAAGGYWQTTEIPTAFTAELHDAIRKCMLDGKCR